MWINNYNCSNHIERKQTLAQVADSINHRKRLLEREKSYPGHINVFEERGDQRVVFDTAEKINLLERF